jgi:hypothetical protein
VYALVLKTKEELLPVISDVKDGKRRYS